MRVACVGEAMIELSLKGEDAKIGVAGDTLNTAVYLHRSAPDLTVDYITRLGDDPFSTKILDFIADQGVGTQAIETETGASPGLYAITTTPEGERSFTYWRSNAAARRMFQTGESCDFSVLQDYDVVYLSGISLAILPPQARQHLVSFLQNADVRLAYDSNYRPGLWENPEIAQSITTAMWRRADIALPSLDDEMALFGETPAAVADRFAKLNCTGALKRGAEGPLSLGCCVQQHYAPAAQVVDTTAAGDSFNGGYLGALLQGADQPQALQAGHALASKVVQVRGAIIPA